uniref:Uncharacterized protein n=1 Tax=Rhizophora mucronata TaxID=61149 RepID=A0A2P2NRS2_RHIMU
MLTSTPHTPPQKKPTLFPGTSKQRFVSMLMSAWKRHTLLFSNLNFYFEMPENSANFHLISFHGT